MAKPPGLPVVPGRTGGTCLWRALEQARGERLWAVHRIDQNTSGAVLFARDAAWHRALSMAFEHGDVRKTYVAFTLGVPEPREGVIGLPLRAARKGKMRPAKPGEPGLAAATAYRVLGVWPTRLGPVAEVEVTPRTGRQHQIRVHLRATGTPLLVDPVYARRPTVTAAELGAAGGAAWGRLTLHAASLEFAAKPEGGKIRVDAPLPEDLAYLRKTLIALKV